MLDNCPTGKCRRLSSNITSTCSPCLWEKRWRLGKNIDLNDRSYNETDYSNDSDTESFDYSESGGESKGDSGGESGGETSELCRKFRKGLRDGEYTHFTAILPSNDCVKDKTGYSYVSYTRTKAAPKITVKQLTKEFDVLGTGVERKPRNPNYDDIQAQFNSRLKRKVGYIMPKNKASKVPYKSICVCKTEFYNFAWLINKKTKDIIVIGDICFRRFCKKDIGIPKGKSCKCLECNKAIRKSKKNYGVLCSECLKDMNNYVYVGNWKCCFHGIYKNKHYQYIWNVDCDYLIRLYNNGKINNIKVNKWIKLQIYKKDFM